MSKSERIEVKSADDSGAPEPVASGDAPVGPGGDVEEAPRSGSEADATPTQSLEARVAGLEAALAESHDQTLRAQAELENLRRRAQRDVENAHKFGVERFVAEVLPVLDSMEMGLKAAEQDGVGVESLKEGTELTLRMLQSALGKFDVEEINPENAPFDPERHQAMSAQEREGVAAGTVLQVYQKGYSLAGRLVRPAMVVVAR